MLAGTLMCVFATNIQMLMVSRLIQGLGAGAGAAMWRSIFRDVYTGADLAKYGSYLAIGVTFIIPAAPAFGAYLQHYFGWRSIFIFLALYTIATLLIVLFAYRETSQHHHLNRFKLSFIKKTFGELLSNRTFVGVTLAALLSFGGLFAWMTSAPVLLIHLSGMHTVAFGWFLFVGVGGAYASAGFLNGQLVARFGIHNMMRFGFFVMLLSGIFLMIGYFLWGINIWNIAPMMILFYFGAMFIFPNSNAIAFTPFGTIAGYAAALYGSFQIGGGAILGGVISHLPEPNQVPLATVILLAISIAWLCFEVIIPRTTN